MKCTDTDKPTILQDTDNGISLNTLRMGSFKLFKRPFLGFSTNLTL